MDQPPLSSAEGKNEWSYTSILPFHVFMAYCRGISPFTAILSRVVRVTDFIRFATRCTYLLHRRLRWSSG